MKKKVSKIQIVGIGIAVIVFLMLIVIGIRKESTVEAEILKKFPNDMAKEYLYERDKNSIEVITNDDGVSVTARVTREYDIAPVIDILCPIVQEVVEKRNSRLKSITVQYFVSSPTVSYTDSVGRILPETLVSWHSVDGKTGEFFIAAEQESKFGFTSEDVLDYFDYNIIDSSIISSSAYSTSSIQARIEEYILKNSSYEGIYVDTFDWEEQEICDGKYRTQLSVSVGKEEAMNDNDETIVNFASFVQESAVLLEEAIENEPVKVFLFSVGTDYRDYRGAAVNWVSDWTSEETKNKGILTDNRRGSQQDKDTELERVDITEIQAVLDKNMGN